MLGNSEGSGEKSYMTNDLLIYGENICTFPHILGCPLSCTVYDFALTPDPIWISLYMRNFFIIVGGGRWWSKSMCYFFRFHSSLFCIVHFNLKQPRFQNGISVLCCLPFLPLCEFILVQESVLSLYQRTHAPTQAHLQTLFYNT
jgi:hypothetical protein